ncbi:MAG: prepilin peptidase [Nitrospirae bacterium]|nr:prepilin peptidase [Nitrospirota bacterium]
MFPYIVVLTFGLVVGSFLNVCIYRLPLEKSIVSPPSSCPHCHTRILPWDNIPVLSYLILLGKCRHCKEKISIRYPLVELLNGLLYVLTFYKFHLTPYSIFYMVFVSSLIVIIFIDFDHMIIPDVITIPGAIAGLIASAFILPDVFNTSQKLGIVNSIIGLAVGFGVFYTIAFLGEKILKKEAMGGGDIKMMAMTGAVLGWKAVLMAMFAGSFIGSIYGISVMIVKGKNWQSRIPFGPFLAIGTLLSLYFGRELLFLYLHAGRR